MPLVVPGFQQRPDNLAVDPTSPRFRGLPKNPTFLGASQISSIAPLVSLLWCTPEEQLRKAGTHPEQERFSCVPTTRGTQKKRQGFQIVDGTLPQQKVTPNVPWVGEQAVDGTYKFH
jgi:hypothetical protein